MADQFVDLCQNYSDFFKAQERNSAKHARHYLSGLLSETVSKNMEWVQDRIADSDYEGMQHFISSSCWNQRPLLDQLARDVDGLLGGDAHSALIVDETCFSKKGQHCVGVQRQYNGNLGKVDNCQCGVFAGLACHNRASLIDLQLYLPKEWIEDQMRCGKAKVPKISRVLYTKIDLAVSLVQRAINNGVRFAWVSADSFYGHSSEFRHKLEDQGLNYVCDVKKSLKVYFQGQEQSLELLALAEFAHSSQRATFGSGTKGKLSCQGTCLPVELMVAKPP